MPYRWETFSIQPQEGYVTNIASLRQGMELPGSAARLINFEPSIDGGYRRINGFSKFDANEVTGTGQVFGVAYFDGSVIAVRNGNIYESVGAGWSSIATGRSHSTKHRYHIINFNGTRKLIGVDGVNYPYSWDGTNFVNINGSTDVLGAKHVVEFKDHMFYSKGDLVTFSEPFDETGFTVADGAGNFRVRGEVTGMIVFRERLFIFTEGNISVLDGDSQSDFRLTSVSEDIGCIQEDTIQEVAGDVAFLSSDGIRLLGATDRTGDFSNQVSSRVIQEPFKEFHREYVQYSSTVIREKSQYRIFGFTTGREPQTTEGYIGVQREAQNPLSFQWSEIVGMKVYAADSQVYNGEEITVFVNGDDNGYIYLMESGSTFDGEGIFSQYWTPYISFTDPTFRKTIYKVWTYFDPEGSITGTLNLNFDFDVASRIQPPTISFSNQGGGVTYGSGVYGTAIFAGESEDTILETSVLGSGRNTQFRFDFEGSEPFIIDAVLIEFSNEDRN